MANNGSVDVCVSQFSQDRVLFLIIILVTTGFNILIAAALIAESKTNRSIRVILLNLLFSGVVSSIAIIMYDCSVFSERSDLTVEEQFSADTPWWQVVIVIFYFGGSSQALFATMYAVIMFLLVRFWEKRVIRPKYTKYFIITAVVIWIVAFLSASPLMSKDVTYDNALESCNCFAYSTSFVVLYSILFSILPAILSVIFLIVTVYYYKRYTSNDEANDKFLTGLLKFAFFLLAIQTVNVAAYVILPIMYINLVHRLFDDKYFSFRSLFDAIHLTAIPTPICVLVFIKPVRDTLTSWATCSFIRQKYSSTTGATGIKETETERMS